MDWKTAQANEYRLHNEMYNTVQQFNVGDIVYAIAPYQSMLQTGTRKFRQDFVGPFIVSDVFDDTHYQLKVTDGTNDIITPGIWHVNRLKRACEMTPEGTVQSEVALKLYLGQINNSEGSNPSHNQLKATSLLCHVIMQPENYALAKKAGHLIATH